MRAIAITIAAALLIPAAADAQIYKLTKEQLTELTAQNPFERFPDGRPKVPDNLMERAKGMSAEEVWAIVPRRGGPLPATLTGWSGIDTA